MVWFRKNSLIHRFVPLLLLAVMLVGQITPVYASTTATTEEGVGSSLYSVTTALTAFASNVVGANTNDKHSDDHDVAKDHRLFELNSGDVGDAGCSGIKHRSFKVFKMERYISHIIRPRCFYCLSFHCPLFHLCI